MKPCAPVFTTAACLALSAWQGRALACSVILPQKQTLSCGAVAAGTVPHTAATGAQLRIESVQVQRSRYAPPGLGDCGELGSTTVTFRLAGSQEWPSDMGVLVSLRQGNFIYFQPPLTSLGSASGWLFLPGAVPSPGSVRFFGPDDPSQPLELLLDARAIDCNDNLSAPVELRISDPGQRRDAGATGGNPPSLGGSGGSALISSGPSPGSETQTPPRTSTAACSVIDRAPARSRRGLTDISLGVLALMTLRRSLGARRRV
jgi:hypothetical protein